jgi:RpiR family carbohydrate utilization transcriptional regulator
VPDLIEKIFDFALSSLEHARWTLDKREVGRAVDLLADAGEILFIGFGASGIVSQDAQQRFPLFGAPCSAPADAHQQLIAASLVTPRTVVVAVSITGRTQSLIHCLQIANANGARSIGISGGRTPMLDHCEVGLVVETLENTDLYTPTISRLAALVVIDILATATALRQPPKYIDRLRTMKEQLAAMRTGELGPGFGEPGRWTRRHGRVPVELGPGRWLRACPGAGERPGPHRPGHHPRERVRVDPAQRRSPRRAQ